jgi:hypothetical protein
VNAIFKTRNKALFGFCMVCSQQKGKTVQSDHVLSENLLKVFAAGVFSGPFNGFLFVFAAEHLRNSLILVNVRKKNANGFSRSPVT